MKKDYTRVYGNLTNCFFTNIANNFGGESNLSFLKNQNCIEEVVERFKYHPSIIKDSTIDKIAAAICIISSYFIWYVLQFSC